MMLKYLLELGIRKLKVQDGKNLRMLKRDIDQ